MACLHIHSSMTSIFQSIYIKTTFSAHRFVFIFIYNYHDKYLIIKSAQFKALRVMPLALL